MPPLSVVDHSVDVAEENRNDVQPTEHGPDTVDDVDGPHEIDPEVFFFVFFLAPDEDDGEKNPFDVISNLVCLKKRHLYFIMYLVTL